jgi:3-oxoacyl-[acyl-carrier protein] reductase
MATAQAVKEYGAKALVAVEDVAETKAMAAVAQRAVQEFGKVDILVNNAGIGGAQATIDAVDEAMFNRMFDVHVKGTYFTTRAVVPNMKKRGSGRIINISSTWGMVGHHFDSAYCGAKAAVLGLTKAWAKEFAPFGVTVNAIAPGSVTTPMTIGKIGIDAARERMKTVPLGRWAEPDEIAHAVLYLVSANSRFITGQVLSPNGGQTIVGI